MPFSSIALLDSDVELRLQARSAPGRGYSAAMSANDAQSEPSSPAPTSAIELAPGVVVPRAAVTFAASRASGPGGQNVNKVNTRAELRIALDAIPLPPGARGRLRRLAGKRVNAAGELLIAAEEHRSQSRNKEAALERLRELVARALVPPKPRIRTKPTKASRERRIDAKKRRSDVKKARGRPRRNGDLD